jgi:Protein of unknown function (DUF1499)
MVQSDDKIGTTPETSGRSLLLPVLGVMLAIGALAILVAAGFGSRFGLWHFRTGFTLLKYGAWCGLAAALVSLTAASHVFKGKRMFAIVLVLAGLTGGVVAFALPVQWKLAAQRLPRIHDITTDTFTPPRFVAIVPLRKDAANPVEYGGSEIAVLQRTAYPDLVTAILNLPTAQAFERALDTARGMGWEIVAAVPGEWRIEATDTTFWFGFKDDIVIRITPAENRSLVDIRSVSRVGVSDVGTNAKRIRAYLKKLAGHG